MNFLNATVARYIYAIPFIIFGIFHFMDAQNMAGMVPEFFPFPAFWVYLTGVALILAAVSIIIEKYTYLACLLLALMLLIFVLTIHLPGGQEAMPNLLKDLSLAGAALFIGNHYKNSGDAAAAADE